MPSCSGSYEFLVDQEGRMVKSATEAMSGMPMESLFMYLAGKCGVEFPSFLTKSRYLRVQIAMRPMTKAEVQKWARTHPGGK